MNWMLLMNSLLLSGGTALLAGAFGLMVALCACGLPVRLRHALLAFAGFALALPPFLVTNCWLDLLGVNGILQAWLPLNLYSLGGAVWILALVTWPIAFLAAYAAWQRLTPEHLEVEPLLRGWHLARWVLWPMGRASLGMASLVVFVLALNNVAVPAILQVKVLPDEVWIQFNFALDNLAALKLGWPLLVAPLLLFPWLHRRDILWPRRRATVPPAMFRQRLGRTWFFAATSASALVAGLSVLAPLGQLLFNRGTWGQWITSLQAGWPAFGNSIALAGGTATVALAGGLLVLWMTTGFANPRPGMAGWWLWLPFFAPGILLGVFLIAFLNRPFLEAVYRSGWVMLIALAIRYAAPAWFGARQALEGLDRRLIDAARIEGASGFGLIRLAIWPQIRSRLAAAWYVVYLLCLWDVETLVLIQPPGGETLALRVFNLLHYGHHAHVNALCLWLLVLAALPGLGWMGWLWVTSRRHRR